MKKAVVRKKTVIRVSCLVFRENPLVGPAVALVGVAGGQGKNMFRVQWLVKTQQAVLPARTARGQRLGRYPTNSDEFRRIVGNCGAEEP